jgi:hypothetical protein
MSVDAHDSPDAPAPEAIEFVLVATSNCRTRRFHLPGDNPDVPGCRLGKPDTYTYERVERATLGEDWECCQYCAGEYKAAGAGNSLAATLWESDPEDLGLDPRPDGGAR